MKLLVRALSSLLWLYVVVAAWTGLRAYTTLSEHAQDLVHHDVLTLPTAGVLLLLVATVTHVTFAVIAATYATRLWAYSNRKPEVDGW